MIKGKKGEISITILVIGVFAVCGLALLTFMISDFKLSNSFSGIGVMEDMSASVDELLFYRSSGLEMSKIEGIFSDDIITEGGKKYLYYEKENFALFGSDEGISFSVRYPIG